MPSEIEMKFNIEKSKKDLLACCINFGQKAKNTIENAFETDNWLKKNSEIQKVILITSYYHLPRSILIFKKKFSQIQKFMQSLLSKKSIYLSNHFFI